MREGAFPLADLAGADEAFTSSSVREVMPAVELDGTPLGDGRPGPAAGGAPVGAAARRDRVSINVYSCAQRPDLWEQAYEEITDVWPPYNEKGDVLGRYWSRLDEDFRDFQFVLYDEERGLVLAQGHSIPSPGTARSPGCRPGIDGVIDGAVRLFDEGGEPNTLSALAIEIPPEHQGGGLSRTMVGAMRDIAAGARLREPDRAAPADVEGALPAHADRALRGLDE